jgi:hypothetical protein
MNEETKVRQWAIIRGGDDANARWDQSRSEAGWARDG